jgi:hypothetical protein
MQKAALDLLENTPLPGEVAKNILAAVELEIAAHHTELATKSDLLRLEFATKAEFAEVRTEITALRTELKLDLAQLGGKIDASRTECIRWIMGVWIAQTTFLVGAVYFLVNFVKQ